MFNATDGGPAVADVEALAQRLYMSDPDGGFGHGAWDAEDCLRPAVKDRFREFAKNLLLPCEKCPPMPALGPPSLPEPDVNNPEQCRFVSEVSRRLEPEVADGYADWERGLTAREWGQRADRLEREQAAKTAQDHAIEQAAQVIHEAYGREWCDADDASRRLNRARAQALADAGLLNTKHGDGSGSEPKCGEA